MFIIIIYRQTDTVHLNKLMNPQEISTNINNLHSFPISKSRVELLFDFRAGVTLVLRIPSIRSLLYSFHFSISFRFQYFQLILFLSCDYKFFINGFFFVQSLLSLSLSFIRFMKTNKYHKTQIAHSLFSTIYQAKKIAFILTSIVGYFWKKLESVAPHTQSEFFYTW